MCGNMNSLSIECTLYLLVYSWSKQKKKMLLHRESLWWTYLYKVAFARSNKKIDSMQSMEQLPITTIRRKKKTEHKWYGIFFLLSKTILLVSHSKLYFSLNFRIKNQFLIQYKQYNIDYCYTMFFFPSCKNNGTHIRMEREDGMK